MKINGLKFITLVIVLAMTLSFCGCKRMNVLNDTSSDVASTDSEYTASTVITQTSTPDKSTSSTVSIEQPSTSTPEYPTTSGTTSGSGTTTTPTTSTPSTSTPSRPTTSTPSSPTTSTPSSPTTSTPSTPSTTPSTPSDSTSDDAGLEGKDWFYAPYIDGTTGEEKQCRCYYVTIGQRQFLVNYDAVYGVCNKCGLNDCGGGRIYTCSNCGYTGCGTTFADKNTETFSCPYCLSESMTRN